MGARENGQCPNQGRHRTPKGRNRPEYLRQLRRAPRPLHLRRALRARIAPFGREGLPPGRARSDAGASHIAGALAGRQLRLGLPLGGRHRPAGRTPDAHRPGMGLPREQRVRHR
ncbi:MAG: hypothetical protein ACLUQ6_04310 [Alistipes onderdonkii]